MGSGRTLALLGAALAALVGGALYLVMSDDVGGPGDGDAPPADGAPGEPGKGTATPGAGPRRRPKVAGTAAVSGVVRRREGSVAAAGQGVVVTREGMEPWTATADDQGNFRIDELGEGGPYELVVESKGFATIRLPGIALNRGEKRDVGTLWLDAAARATVTVRTQAAEPVAGAKVSAYAAPNYEENYDWSKAVAQMAAEPVAVATRETDAKGAAVFPELASGSWTFVATKPGLSREGRANVRLEGGDSVDDIEILLRAAHAVKGRVFSESGAPVPGALVIATRMANFWDIGNGALRVRTAADAEGKFRVDTLAAGTWSLLAAAPGGVPALAATIKVPAVQEIDLRLATGGKLTGKVTNVDTGAPVEGAVVRAVSWAGSAQVAESTTDATGAYSFDPLPAPLVNDITVEKAGLVLERTGVRWQVTMVPAGDSAVRDFALRTGGTVDGVVTAADGKPLAGARVQLWVGRVNEGGDDVGATTTDADGRFHYDGVGKGTAIAMVRGDGLYQRDWPQDGWWSALQSPVRHAWMGDAGPGIATKLEVRMERGLRVSGTVEGPDGPVAGATVHAGVRQVRSGKDGAFVVEGIAPTPNLELSVRATGFVAEKQTTVAVTEGTPLDDVRLVLLRQPVLRGKVYPAPGLTLADARVALSGAFDGDDMEMMLPSMSEDDAAEWHAVRADGAFSIPLPAATGQWTVRATADGHATASSEPVEVSPAQQEYETSVTLVVGDVISGRVVSAGAGVAGARIGLTLAAEEADMMFVNGMSGMTTIYATTDAAGLFAVTNVGPGKYTVEASAPGLVTESKSGVKPGSPAIEFVLAPELELGGQVVFEDGTPCPGVTVSAQREGRKEQNFFGGPQTGGVPAGSDGRFVVRGLAEGRYRLVVEAPWGGGVNVRRTTSEPIAAGTRDAKITAQRGLTISGHVLDAAKKPAAGCWVNAQPEGPGDHNWTGVQTKDDGTFEVLGLGEGSYTVHVQRNTMEGAAARPAQRSKIAAGTKNLEIVLEEGLVIEGTLVDAAGKPIGQVHLNAQPLRNQDEDDEDGEPSFGQGAQVGADGKFRIGGLAPGRYSIQMHIWDNSGAAASKVLTGGESIAAGTSGVRLVAVEGQRIGGVCVDEAGAAVEGVQVMMHVPSSGFWRQAETKADGKFELAGVPEGKHTLTFSGGGRTTRQMDDIAAGTRDLRVELARGLTISGRILRGDGTAAAGVQIHLTRADDQAHGWAMTGADGEFTAEGLSAGSYKISATVPKADSENAFEVKELGTAKAGDSSLQFTLR